MPKVTVLVVDDSPTELKLVVTALQQKGYDVITATNGEEGLEKATRERPSLVIFDVVMPKMNGFQACRQLKTNEATKTIPVLLLTSKSQESDKFWGFRQGADGYVTKPFTDDSLFAEINKLI